MDSKPLTVLVTGSSGFIGQHVVRHLAAAGHKVIGYDLIPPEDRFPDGSIYLCGDIRTDRLPHQGIDAVVHLAALAGVRPSMDRPFDYLSTNVTGTLRLLEHCRIHGIPHFVFASSSSVYGSETPLPAEESAVPDPCSPYALTKLHGEQWGRLYSRIHGLRFLALRFFSVWGPGQRPDLALECFRRRLLDGKPLIIHGDGSQRRDLTHVEDVARAVELALHWPGPGSAVLNIGTGRNHSVMDMLDAVRKQVAALQFSAPNFTFFTPPVVHQNPHPADVPETLANHSKATACIGWKPRIFFPETGDS
jgi:UDP-glucuronate 4-epimerase